MEKIFDKTIVKMTLWFFCLLSVACFVSCEDMLKTETDHYLNTDGHELNSPNDTLYSMVGILRKMQTIADRYVLVGELRGDLLDVTENADMDLQAIHDFDFGMESKNPYLSSKEYYDIINNCNFFIKRVNETTSSPKDVMEKELAAVTTIRTWVYMQLILNYGTACYYEDPILTIAGMNKIKNDPDAWINDLNVLLERVQDSLWKARTVQSTKGNPAYQGITNITKAFIPAALVLGDLFLYTGQPDMAAIQYNSYLYSNGINITGRYLRWGDAGFDSYTINRNSSEIISSIFSTTENGSGSQLMTWCYPIEWSNTVAEVKCTYQLKPSKASMDLWNRQEYAFLPNNVIAHDSLIYTTGDLRGTFKENYTRPPYASGSLSDSYAYFLVSEGDSLPFIHKYGAQDGNNYVNQSYIYRAGLVYLRYAEALNRLGKPSLAFAALKYGISNEVLADPAKVNPAEVTPTPEYCYFQPSSTSSLFSMGIHSRGSGASQFNTYYQFPATCTTLVDSIQFVDEKICDELAVETAFEGNRFQDLMRFAKIYGPEFLAKRVAARRGTVDAILQAKLMDDKNWYLPKD
ncbi:MAG: hypothetical protein EZS26_000503 [Candidatus Ordinivivax streblomastigis]|uniref:RagB/SusD domain-containing protein n=1 Tax=Candidatus Ordinivivax streblomastigis TaxID=2540710 RepID=A0A5M8P4K3_9BACT|nr:MAG: hypothetical protein EZS26_000464 [Candidatus Ordinivivax streblomastigis]KAA6303343.1 MAG: hypothetical protein EZS26_000503 [Candidatus Ordinivivax streblomastigis]